MADKLDEPEFWLPSEFLTDEDILMDNKENISKFMGRYFPNDFPYEYGSSVLSSPVESLVGSPETESDEDDLVVHGLTRQFTLNRTQKFSPTHQIHEEKVRVLSISPQSTLTQVGSWSGRSNLSSNGSTNGPSEMSSPPTTPSGENNDDWDLIYQAAELVARLKMNSRGAGPIGSPSFLGPPGLLTTHPQPRNSASGLYQTQLKQHSMREQMLKQETSGIWSRQVKNGWSYEMGGMGQSSCAWPSQQVHQRNQQQLYGELGLKGAGYPGCGYGYGFRYGSGGGGGCGGGGLKKERAGTGVFLPRPYDNNTFRTSDSRKKPGSSTAWLPNKVFQASTKDINGVHAIVESKSRQNDSFMAKRNALLAHQRPSLCPEGGGSSISHEICLPQEWTY